MTREKLAVLTVTKQGIGLGEKLLAARPEAELWVPDKYAGYSGPRYRYFDGKLGDLLAKIFHDYAGFVFIMATGIVVRLIADHIKDKRFDPAVVVMDIKGKFAISLCSGHLGGANELAREVAEIIGAIPVVTTGTDVNETIAPDMLAKEMGGEVDDFEAMKRVSAALVDGEKVGVVDLAGVRLKSLEGELKGNVKVFPTLGELNAAGCRAAIVITDRVLPVAEQPASRYWVILRPKSLVVGVGCNRNTEADEIRRVIADTLEAHGLSSKSVRNLASADLKQDEPGLLACANASGLTVEFFSRERLNAVEVPNPSEQVERFVGTKGVAEPAALLSAGAGSLLVPKVKSGNVTVAVARVVS
ncbi:MAG: cobalt-precorrin 5A hydrolase [candidate division NC10 bacterium]|jgi:cobalt-precorrin 5A hydrolase